MPDTVSGQADFGTKTAQILLDIKAVNFRPEQPYKLTSGWASPVYIDCRKIISFTQERRAIIDMAVKLLGRDMDLKALNAVAGGETAGIPYAAWIAEAVSLPMLYVRKQPKGFGRNAQIEGDMAEGSHVLLVEDLATDGASKLNFVNALRKAGATVSDAFVVFYYGVFSGALDSLKAEGITMHYLATWRDVLRVAAERKSFPESAIAEVRKFLDDPISWSAAHGGKGET
ncbi:MAG: orotate phosphoribosyltransferase [Rhodospirillales bacterium]